MNFWSIAIAVCLLLLPAAANANANCVDAERGLAIMGTSSKAFRAANDAARARVEATSVTLQTFARLVAENIASWERQKRAVDRTIVLVNRAIAKGCPSGSVSFITVKANLEDLSRMLANDIRVFKETRAKTLRAIREDAKTARGRRAGVTGAAWAA